VENFHQQEITTITLNLLPSLNYSFEAPCPPNLKDSPIPLKTIKMTEAKGEKILIFNDLIPRKIKIFLFFTRGCLFSRNK
jgi:hypothetical protein